MEHVDELHKQLLQPTLLHPASGFSTFLAFYAYPRRWLRGVAAARALRAPPPPPSRSPQVFFASRTHSQLAQFVGELRKVRGGVLCRRCAMLHDAVWIRVRCTDIQHSCRLELWPPANMFSVLQVLCFLASNRDDHTATGSTWIRLHVARVPRPKPDTASLVPSPARACDCSSCNELSHWPDPHACP